MGLWSDNKVSLSEAIDELSEEWEEDEKLFRVHRSSRLLLINSWLRAHGIIR